MEPIRSGKNSLSAFADELEGELEKISIFGVHMTRKISMSILAIFAIICVVIGVWLGVDFASDGAGDGDGGDGGDANDYDYHEDGQYSDEKESNTHGS